MATTKGAARRVAQAVEEGVLSDEGLVSIIRDAIRFRYLMERCLTKQGDIIQYSPDLISLIDEEITKS